MILVGSLSKDIVPTVEEDAESQDAGVLICSRIAKDYGERALVTLAETLIDSE